MTQDEKAKHTVQRYIYWSMGAGLIPLPFVDLAAVFGIQVKMIYDLSKEYNIAFSKSRVKSLVASLVGGAVPTAVGGAVSTLALGSMAKTLPYIGTVVGVVSVPVFCGASTYALGRVFIQHFASGGTFLDFDPAAVREYYRTQFEAGKDVARGMAAEMKQNVDAAAGPQAASARTATASGN